MKWLGLIWSLEEEATIKLLFEWKPSRRTIKVKLEVEEDIHN